MADLLQVELEQRGCFTLDRSLIRAIVAEKIRSVGNSDLETESLSAISITGAKRLIKGLVIPLTGTQCRVEVSITSAETFETVAISSCEGQLPRELPLILATIANDLIPSLLVGSDTKVAHCAPSLNRPNPESLIAYYQGLDCYAAGYPEIAATWFANAAELDPTFVPPQLWELKAYRSSGLEWLAEARLITLSNILAVANDTASNPPTGTNSAVLTVSVLDPLVSSTPSNNPSISSTIIKSYLRTAFQRSPCFRLLDQHRISASVKEQDRSLNVFFSPTDACRYGRWNLVDALVACKIRAQPDGDIVIGLSLLNPLSSTILTESHTNTHLEDLQQAINELASKIAPQNRPLPQSSPAVPPQESQPYQMAARGQTEGYFDFGAINRWQRLSHDEHARIIQLPALYQDLAGNLIELNHPTGEPNHGIPLVDCFVALNRETQAQATLRHAIKSTTLDDTNAPALLFQYATLPSTVSYYPGAQRLKHLPIRECRDLAATRLTNDYPHSIWSARLRLTNAREQWAAGDMAGGSVLARAAQPVIHQFLATLRQQDSPDTHAATCRDLAQCLCIQADAAASSIDTNATLVALSEIRSFLHANGTGETVFAESNLPPPFEAGPLTGTQVIQYKWPLDRQPGYYALQLEAKIRGNSSEPSAAIGRATRNVETILQNDLQPQQYDLAASQLIEALENNCDNYASWTNWAPLLKKALPHYATRRWTGPGHRGLVHKLLIRAGQVVLKLSHIPQGTAHAGPDIDQISSAASDVVWLFRCCSQSAEWLDVLGPFFEAPYPVDIGISLLLAVDKPPSRIMKEKMEQLTQRRQPGKPSLPFAVWMKYANKLSSEDDHEKAFGAYKTAFELGAPRQQYAHLLVSLLILAMKGNPERIDDAIDRLGRELGLEHIEISHEMWFCAARYFHEIDMPDKAITCYRHVLVYDKPYHVPHSFFDYQVFAWGADMVLHGNDTELGMGWSVSWQYESTSARYWLAACLGQNGQLDEAAETLRDLARRCGNESFPVIDYYGSPFDDWNGIFRINIGPEATRLLELVHTGINPWDPRSGTNYTGNIHRKIEWISF